MKIDSWFVAFSVAVLVVAGFHYIGNQNYSPDTEAARNTDQREKSFQKKWWWSGPY